jgi:tripartite-type tricarboxylate transporter receptor subunit TctC
MKLRFVVSLAALLAVVATIGNVEAQPYPSRTIKLIVPYAPGGAGDVIARIVSVELAKDLRVSVVVENKPGGG